MTNKYLEKIANTDPALIQEYKDALKEDAFMDRGADHAKKGVALMLGLQAVRLPSYIQLANGVLPKRTMVAHQLGGAAVNTLVGALGGGLVNNLRAAPVVDTSVVDTMSADEIRAALRERQDY